MVSTRVEIMLGIGGFFSTLVSKGWSARGEREFSRFQEEPVTAVLPSQVAQSVNLLGLFISASAGKQNV